MEVIFNVQIVSGDDPYVANIIFPIVLMIIGQIPGWAVLISGD